MASLLRRVPPLAATCVIGVALTVLFASVLWLAQRAGTNDTADEQQTQEIARNDARLAEVSTLAADLQAGLEKANNRLARNGSPTVPVPTAAPGAVNGVDGADGEPGDSGSDGLDGADGQEGSAGAPGAAGPSGAPGAAGGAGPTGAPGQQGPKGDPGPAGPAGAAGRDGTDGVDGQDGAPGAAGAPGQPGADGKPPASFTFTDALGITYTCTDPETDGDYICRAA